MKIEATYSDGWTERLLHWKLEINEGRAYLEADWSRNPVPLRVKFQFDEASFRAVLPSISGMREEYLASWEDLEDRVLIVRNGGTSTRYHVYGASPLVQEYPEIESFLSVWKLLEDAVSVHLPAKSRD